MAPASEAGDRALAAMQAQDWYVQAVEVARDWATVSDEDTARSWEIAAWHTAKGRFHEVNALIGTVGVDLDLGVVALAEAELWRVHRTALGDDGDPVGRTAVLRVAAETGHRAMAELSGYYLLGVGHALINLCLRVVGLDDTTRNRLAERKNPKVVLGAPWSSEDAREA